MIIHVRNFGKIESADIDVENMVVFVGENNSGKTYIMQLIYGLLLFLNDVNNHVEIIKNTDLFSNLVTNKNIEIKSNELEYIQQIQNVVNKYIENCKTELIKSIFHTKDLTIESLWIEFNEFPFDISLVHEKDIEKSEEYKEIYSIKINDGILYKIRFPEYFSEKQIYKTLKRELLDVIISGLMNFNLVWRGSDVKEIIYLPASRSGIMLLYANYLSNDNKRDGIDGVEIETGNDTDKENEYGLTQPVYDFLMFLLKHKTSEMISDNNKALIEFINQNIINGRLEKVGNTVRYVPGESEKSIPIFLSSSLVSELAPIYQILSGIQRFKYIMYDEIETCQHPTKQLQLARLLIRMVNSGYRLIVSTHSDTMASAINNLITLSLKNKRGELLDRLGYEAEDLINADCIRAYQFLINKEGRTVVKEVPGYFSIGVGFDFDIFNKTNDKIYQDALALAEVD